VGGGRSATVRGCGRWCWLLSREGGQTAGRARTPRRRCERECKQALYQATRQNRAEQRRPARPGRGMMRNGTFLRLESPARRDCSSVSAVVVSVTSRSGDDMAGCVCVGACVCMSVWALSGGVEVGGRRRGGSGNNTNGATERGPLARRFFTACRCPNAGSVGLRLRGAGGGASSTWRGGCCAGGRGRRTLRARCRCCAARSGWNALCTLLVCWRLLGAAPTLRSRDRRVWVDTRGLGAGRRGQGARGGAGRGARARG